jgi:hypothetical protein
MLNVTACSVHNLCKIALIELKCGIQISSKIYNVVFPLKGCLEDLEKWFKEDTTILIGLGIGIAFFHVSK